MREKQKKIPHAAAMSFGREVDEARKPECLELNKSLSFYLFSLSYPCQSIHDLFFFIWPSSDAQSSTTTMNSIETR